jgi:hypothetical protein
VWTGLIWLSIGSIDGCSEHNNESLSSVKGGKFLDQLIVVRKRTPLYVVNFHFQGTYFQLAWAVLHYCGKPLYSFSHIVFICYNFQGSQSWILLQTAISSN